MKRIKELGDQSKGRRCKMYYWNGTAVAGSSYATTTFALVSQLYNDTVTRQNGAVARDVKKTSIGFMALLVSYSKR